MPEPTLRRLPWYLSNVKLMKEQGETYVSSTQISSKQSGGRGQYGHCKVKFEPMDANGEELYKFESTVVGGAIPKEYIPAVGEGIEEAMKAGILGGFPVVGVHANVYDGSYHEVDSSEMAFHIAGSLAFKDAMQKACEYILLTKSVFSLSRSAQFSAGMLF